MSKTIEKYALNGRSNFWEIPCNPITGYRLRPLQAAEPKKVEKLFFSDQNLI